MYNNQNEKFTGDFYRFELSEERTGELEDGFNRDNAICKTRKIIRASD